MRHVGGDCLGEVQRLMRQERVLIKDVVSLCTCGLLRGKRGINVESGRGCWARIFSWIREYSLQWNQCLQAGRTEGGEVKQQQTMTVMAMDINVDGRMDAQN